MIISRDLQPLLELRGNDLVHHGLVRQQEALLTCGESGDYAGIYDLYS